MSVQHDVSTPATTEPADAPRCSIKIVGLEIENLGPIRSLKLPEDGLAWQGNFPDFVMIGGGNGSGKTTVLEAIVKVFEALELGLTGPGQFRAPDELIEFFGSSVIDMILDFQYEDKTIPIRFLANKEPLAIVKHEIVVKLDRGAITKLTNLNIETQGPVLSMFHRGGRIVGSNAPKVLYIPSERRDLIMLDERLKLPVAEEANGEFVHRWSPPRDWKESLEARLYNARWVDLNAEKNGSEPSRFEAYNLAFNRFFEGKKRLHWQVGRESVKLVVKLTNGETHELSALSSGEKQVIVLVAELLRYWRPGSIILIDEPELHCHSSWVTRLWEIIEDFRRERGGQIFVATQSGDLFYTGDPGTKVVLPGGRS